MSRSISIQTKFSTDDLTTPVTVDMVMGIDTGKGDNFQLLGVYFKAVSDITETVTISIISNESTAVFTYLLDSTALSTGQTVIFTPTGFIGLKSKDTVRVAITSASAAVNASTMIQVAKVD